MPPRQLVGLVVLVLTLVMPRAPGLVALASDLSRIGLKWTPALHPDDPLFARR